MKPILLIIGAGGIGRGFIPWLVHTHYNLVLIDINPEITHFIQNSKKITCYRIKNHQLEKAVFPIFAALHPHEWHDFLTTLPKNLPIAAAFVSVGPPHTLEATRILKDCLFPVILCENDPSLIQKVQTTWKIKNIFFSIPDVITSNATPPHLMKTDPLALITEDGTLLMDDQISTLHGDFHFFPTQELFNQQWKTKLYLHNTPHCIAAYLGNLTQSTYIHEAMNRADIRHIVEGSMQEMQIALQKTSNISPIFLEHYAQKEIQRFASPLLYDPILRVARDPLRKLAPQERLMGAAQLCLSAKIIPNNILIGIVSAFIFHKQHDHAIDFPRSTALQRILNLQSEDPLAILLSQQWNTILKHLEKITQLIVDSATMNCPF